MKFKITNALSNAFTVVAVVALLGMVGNLDSPTYEADNALVCFLILVISSGLAMLFRYIYYVIGYFLSMYMIHTYLSHPEKFHNQSREYICQLLWMNSWSLHRTCKYMASLYVVNAERGK